MLLAAVLSALIPSRAVHFIAACVPVLAVLGSCIAILGGLQNPLFIWYLLICGAMLLIAFLYYGRHKNDIHSV